MQSEKSQSPWLWRLGALGLAVLAIRVFTRKPTQPEGYKRYMCQEAWRGAFDECKTRQIPESTCEDIAAVARHCCSGSMPEEYANPE